MTRETLMLRAQSLLPNLPQETLEFACDLVLEQICNYCNLTEAPDGLTNTAAHAPAPDCRAYYHLIFR